MDGLALRTQLSVQTTDVSIYDWDPATEELTPAGYVQPNTPTSLNPSPPTGVTLESDVTTAFIDPSGVARSRILVNWTAPTDGLVLSGGHIEAQYAQLLSPSPFTLATWISVASVDPASTFLYIPNVTDSDQYYVQIRSVNVNEVPSDWVEAGPVTVGGSAYLAIAPVASVQFSISTDGNGNVLVTGVSANNADGSVATSATAIVEDILYVDCTQQASTEINAAFGPSLTTMPYDGAIPPFGYAVIGLGAATAEILYITTPAVSTGNATAERATLGTTAVDWSPVATTISAVNSLWALELTLPTGLAIIPGMRASNYTTQTNSFVTEYNSGTGLCRVSAPLGTAPAPTQSITFYNQLWPLLEIQRTVPIPVGYLGGPNQPGTFDEFPLPSSAVMFAQSKAHNTYSPTGTPSTGSDSAWFQTNGEYPQTNLISPNPIFTHGGTVIAWSYPAIPSGDNLNAFSQANAPETQDFGSASASIANITGATLPIATPPPITDVRLSGLIPGANIVVSGTVDPTAIVTVSVTAGAQVSASPWIAADNGITSGSTLHDMAISLAAFLNADPVFSPYYISYPEIFGPGTHYRVSIADLTNLGGTLVAARTAGVTIFAASGFASQLGILVGAFYSAAYFDATDSYLGSATPFNALESTGPTGGYTSILLGNIPLSTDSRVSSIKLYRAADGTPYGFASPLYAIGSVANTGVGGFTSFVDSMTESTLLTQATYPGPTQPTRANDVIVRVSQNGNEWFELHVPPNAVQSNVVPGVALRGLGIGASLTAEVVNNIGTLDFSMTMA